MQTALATNAITLTLAPDPIDQYGKDTFARLAIKDGVAFLTRQDCQALARKLEEIAKQL